MRTAKRRPVLDCPQVDDLATDTYLLEQRRRWEIASEGMTRQGLAALWRGILSGFFVTAVLVAVVFWYFQRN